MNEVSRAESHDATDETQRLKTPEDARSSREALLALQNVYIEAEALHQQSSVLFERIHGQGELSMARRNLLADMLQGDPQTVPKLARAKRVSRQYMQRLVNQLEDEGYVELVENSAHKRSHLVQLTPRGRDHIVGMLQREMKLVAAMVIDVPMEQLRQTAESLRAIREWQKDEYDRLLSSHIEGQMDEVQEDA